MAQVVEAASEFFNYLQERVEKPQENPENKTKMGKKRGKKGKGKNKKGKLPEKKTNYSDLIEDIESFSSDAERAGQLSAAGNDNKTEILEEENKQIKRKLQQYIERENELEEDKEKMGKQIKLLKESLKVAHGLARDYLTRVDVLEETLKAIRGLATLAKPPPAINKGPFVGVAKLSNLNISE